MKNNCVYEDKKYDKSAQRYEAKGTKGIVQKRDKKNVF